MGHRDHPGHRRHGPGVAQVEEGEPLEEQLAEHDAFAKARDLAEADAPGEALEHVLLAGGHRLSPLVTAPGEPVSPVAAIGLFGVLGVEVAEELLEAMQGTWVRDSMNNKGDWWSPNWEKKLDGSFKNLAGPDYKHKNNQKMALWLTAQDGGSIVPNWFACPFTGKSSDDLGMVGKQIRARM